MTRTQIRVALVLSRMMTQVLTNEDDAEMYAQDLQHMLSNLANEDAFGSEGQSDPRGDGRNGTFSMSYVEGIDV